MATGYYLQDNPNPSFGQFGWPRTRVSGVIGVHTAESGVIPSGPDGGAENTAGWISRRTDPGSYHALADADSRLKLVHPRYAAWADTTNNAHAMSVSGAMDAARWRDLTPERAAAIVRNMGLAAAELVRDALAAGLLSAPVPARRITAAEAIAGSRAGFYGHGETNPGRRYDPGTNFDWDLFLATYASAISGGTITPQGDTEEDELNKEQNDALGAVFGAVNKAPAAGMLASQGDINIVLARVGALESAVLEALGKKQEPTATLVKGDKDSTVYAWDGGSGYRALDYAEFATLMATGAELKVEAQAKLDAVTGGAK